MDFSSHNKQVRCKSRKFSVEYTWIIENFELCSFGKSPIFSAENDTYQWIMEVTLEENGYINLFLKEANIDGTLENKKCPISGLLELTITPCSHKARLKVSNNKFLAKIKDKFHLDDIKQANDELRIRCKLSYVRLSDTDQHSLTITIPVESTESDAIDSEHYFKSEEYSDVAIYIGDKKYPSHKFVLAARSPVFKAMFGHEELKENQQNRVDIEDIDEKTFERFLSYMYTGKIDTFEDVANALDLLLVAEKYNVEKLKFRCETQIFNMLSVETVVKTLLFFDTHNLPNLKKSSILFIKGHLAEMKKSEYWKDITSRQDLLIDILEA